MPASYTTVTELPGSGATPEQLAMVYTRYHLAATLSRGKDVMEVACGPGMGLGYLARAARTVVGGDYDPDVLRHARAHYQNGVRLLRLDAHTLPFADRSFDLVLLLEALYYLCAPEQFVDEARRVLRPQGAVLLCTANKDWRGFNPSPFAHRYFSASDLRALLVRRGFTVALYGGFPVAAATPRDRLLSVLRRLAVGLRLIPATMRGKERLKRLIYGRLSPLPEEVQDAMATPAELTSLAGDQPATGFKVLYAVGRMP